jgi:hypothetical protein
MSIADNNDIEWDEVVKKEARGIDDAEKGIIDKKDFTCQKALQINLMDIPCGLE